MESDSIISLESIVPVKHSPQGYESNKNFSPHLFYKTKFDENTEFPSIFFHANALHPGNNKQNVKLVLAIFYET